MSQLIAVAYPDRLTAEEVRLKLWRLQSEYLLELEDAVVVTKNAAGTIKLHQAVNLTAAGTVSGGFWGTLVGMLFLNPILGAAVGAASGAIAGAVTDVGINDDFMKALSAKLGPDTSALFVLVRNATPDKVVKEIQQFGGTVLQSSLSHDDEGKLQAALAQGRTASAITSSAASQVRAALAPS
jgi:uncharacterized membrane protein